MTHTAARAFSVAYAIQPHSTDKERDTESGNDYMFARYYNIATGRFLSPDWSAKVAPVPYAKLDNPQSLNLYSYVWNNPLSRTDPDGPECKPCEAFTKAKHDLISVKTTATSGTHDSVSFLGIKVSVSSGASISKKSIHSATSPPKCRVRTRALLDSSSARSMSSWAYP